MIDLHSHIVFNVDDGPKNLDESLALIDESYAQGIRTIVSTSHRRKGMFETAENVIYEHFQIVKTEAEKRHSDLTILYGGELYYTPSLIEKLKNKEVPTINNGHFILIEFSMSTPWKEIHDAVSQVMMLGLRPLIAHIERYNALEKNDARVKELQNMGCLTQVNSNHVLKPKLWGDNEKLFKKRGCYFLEKDLVDCIASDMHNLDKRPPFMAEAYDIVSKQYGQHKAEELFVTTPRIIIEN